MVGFPSADGKSSTLVVIGEKGRAQLVRDRRESIVATIQEVGKVKMTFSQVPALATTCHPPDCHLVPTIPSAVTKAMSSGNSLHWWNTLGPDPASKWVTAVWPRLNGVTAGPRLGRQSGSCGVQW